MTDTQETLKKTASKVSRRLHQAHEQERRLLLLRAVGVLAAAFVGLIVVCLLLDWGLRLPGGVRVVLLLASVATLVLFVRRYLLPSFQRMRLLEMALRVEKAHPSLNSVLVSAVEFERNPDPGPGVSKRLMEWVRNQAEQETAAVDFNQVAAIPHLPKYLAGGGVAVLALVAMLLFWPGYLSVLAWRMINPFAVTMYPTRTKVELVEKHQRILLGEPADVAIRVGGEIPDKAVLFVRSKGAYSWDEIKVQREDDLCQYTIPAVRSDLEYYFHAGDADSYLGTITAVRPPRVLEAEVNLEYPSYMNLPSGTVRTMNLKVPEGTKLVWTLKLDQAVESASMEMEGQSSPRIDVEQDGTVLRGVTRATASGGYQFVYTWQFKGKQHTEYGPKHFLRVQPDAAPRVAMTFPVEDQKATLQKKLVVRFLASDDHGLNNAWLLYAVNDQQEQRKKLDDLGGKTDVTKEITWNVAEEIEDLREGDLLTYRIEVNDGRPGDAPERHGVSQSRRVQFVSKPEYLDYILGQQRRYLGQVRPLYIQERDAAETIRRLTPPGTGLTAEPNTLPSEQEAGP
jgi:hypothetical protein